MLDNLVSLLAPHDCLVCSSEGALLCLACQQSLPKARSKCYKCQQPSRANATCADCSALTPLRSVHAATTYSGSAKDLVWKLKFGRSRAAAGDAADCIVQRLKLRERLRSSVGRRPTRLIITHAPTVNRRVRSRGYDQAGLLARAIDRRVDGLRYRPLLRRYGQQEQIGAGRSQRSDQLSGAFQAINPRRLRGAHVILVDDIVTTGATLEAAARALTAAGAARVDAIVFAQA